MSRYDNEPRANHQVIRALVDSKYRSRSAASRDLGIPNSTLHSIVTGHRDGTAETLATIAAGLGVDVDVITMPRARQDAA